MLGLPLSAQYKCISCGKCAKACKMDVDVTKSPDHTECTRCGMCVRACPTEAVYHYSLLSILCLQSHFFTIHSYFLPPKIPPQSEKSEK